MGPVGPVSKQRVIRRLNQSEPDIQLNRLSLVHHHSRQWEIQSVILVTNHQALIGAAGPLRALIKDMVHRLSWVATWECRAFGEFTLVKVGVSICNYCSWLC